MSRFLLGYDLGSSSVKATLLDADTGKVKAAASYPKSEMTIQAPQPGFAEQHPEDWWRNVMMVTQELLQTPGVSADEILSIGISYQMHGLVLVDKNHKVLRPSIIWCDSRAVEIGDEAFTHLGESYCLEHFLNAPGNFTASKLKWVKDHEPEIFENIHKVMLPGDYLAMKLSGEINTSFSGLSEGIFWDFKEQTLAHSLLDYYGIDKSLLGDAMPSFSDQGKVSAQAAKELGLSTNTRITYRAGDQPNNALSLNVLQPGEVAATAGTSGVVYGVFDHPVYDEQSRVNTFIHVNNTAARQRNGVLLCVNGTGILNSWMRREMTSLSYEEMNAAAALSEPGAKGLQFYPFGNGAERIFKNKNLGASLQNLDFNIHNRNDLLRSAQEGIVFALNYGLDIMKKMGMPLTTVRAGHGNMFLSPVFAQAFANISGVPLELYNTDGSQGAARGAGLGLKFYNEKEAFTGLSKVKEILPDKEMEKVYGEVYEAWLQPLHNMLKDKL